MGDDTAEKFLDLVLASATMCRESSYETADPRKMEGIQQFHELMNLCQTIQVSR